MNEKEFLQLCREEVIKYTNEYLDKQITENDISFICVWWCKKEKKNKALLSTTGMYYEVTYNGDKKELYFNAYKKCENNRSKL